MSLDVDGFAILKAIGEAPGRYGAIDGEVRKAARALVAKQLKSKGLGLAGLRGLRESLGEEALELVLDGMSDAETGRVLAGVDGFYPDLKARPAAELRRRLVQAAEGRQGGRSRPSRPETREGGERQQPCFRRGLGRQGPRRTRAPTARQEGVRLVAFRHATIFARIKRDRSPRRP